MTETEKYVMISAYQGTVRRYDGMVDIADLKSAGGDSVPVRVRLAAPNQYNPNQIFPVGDGFGLFVFFEEYEKTYFRNGYLIRPDSKPRGPRKKKIKLGG